jgi:hypothetical protein
MRFYATACALIVCLGCERRSQGRGDTASRSPALTQCGMVASESDATCILFDPSLIALIAQPAQYDGKRVRTIGFVNLEFEGNGIYVGREDYAQGLSRNALWLGVADSMAQPYRKQLPGYFVIEGTFSSSDHGHMGMFSGAIGHVTRFEPWRSRAQIDSMLKQSR